MLTLSTAATLHLQRDSRRLTIAGVIEKKDGSILRCTQHDQDFDITSGELAGTYVATVAVTGSDVKSSADLSVDNMEISGVIADGLGFTGFDVADIQAGLFDDAPFQTFICQWDDPSAWQIIVKRGYLGEIARTAEGSFQAEWRGMIQALHQQVGRTLSETCDVKRFGDSRCRIDAEGLAQNGTVTSVTSRRRFNSTIAAPAQALTYFDLGELRFLTGANAGYTKQVKRDAAAGVSGQIELWDSLPHDVQIGDTYRLKPGCDRLFSTCVGKWNNHKNFRGDGFWIPGIPNIIRAP